MAVSKVILNGTTLIDTTDKTVTAGSMLNGVTALKNDGTTATGSIASKSATDLTASGATVTAPAGYYSSAASKSVASGTAGTPTASKGTVSNHSISVTPSVTNTTGYISGGTKNGTAVTVSASELVSGTKSITENGTGIDVTNFASVDVAVSGGSSVTVEPLSVTQNGTYTAPTGSAYSPVTVAVSGGGSDYELVASTEVNVSTTSTTAQSVQNLDLPNRITNAIYYIKIRDKAGKRNGYFFGADQWFVDLQCANGATSQFNYRPSVFYGITSDGTFSISSTSFSSSSGTGVFANYLQTIASETSAKHKLNISSRYYSNLGTVDGTFSVEVYKLKWPDDISPLA